MSAEKRRWSRLASLLTLGLLITAGYVTTVGAQPPLRSGTTAEYQAAMRRVLNATTTEEQTRPKKILDGSLLDVCQLIAKASSKRHGRHLRQCPVPEDAPGRNTKIDGFSWVELDTAANKNRIREVLIARPLYFTDFRSITEPEKIWAVMGPIVSELIQTQRVKLRRAKIDIGNNGRPVEVYALSFLPWNDCLQSSRTSSSDAFYLYADSADPVSTALNTQDVKGWPFLYGATTYIGTDSTVYQPMSVMPGTMTRAFYLNPLCQFEPVR